MKKILVVVLVALSATSAFAFDRNDYNVVYKLGNSYVFNSLVRYIDANDEQADQLKYIFELTEQKLSTSNSDETAEKAMLFNVGNAKYILSRDQYKKYLAVLNTCLFKNDTEILTVSK